MARRRRRGTSPLERVALVAGAIGLVGGMVTAVDRGERARSLSEEIGALEREATVAEDRAARAMRRLDSLESREWILKRAGEVGLRPPGDDEITLLRDAEPAGDRR